MSYDGHLFHGFQIQSNQRTVEETVEQALKKITKGKTIKVHGSGRTDAGVHANGQAIHFDYPAKKIPAKNMLMALNSLMPMDIVFTQCEIVDQNFHVQYSTKAKWYRYIVDQNHYTDPFNRFYTGHFPYLLDVDKMRQASKDFIGEHDFSSFAASGGKIQDKVRKIYYIKITESKRNSQVIFDIIGNGFLYNMVRIMVGCLLEIGNDKRPSNDIPRIIQAKNREEVRMTAPASGLYLHQVFYEEIPNKYLEEYKMN